MGERWTVHESDVLANLATIADSSVDACLSDVPYGLGSAQPTVEELIAYMRGDALDMSGDFMGHDWQVPSVAVWGALLRVLKPGAPCLSFAGSRTSDLISIGMRAAGFEIKDTIEWIQSQGMPKPATTTDKYLDWAAGAEREVVGSQTLTGNAEMSTKRKRGTIVEQVGTVEATAIDVTAPATDLAKRWARYGHALRPSHEPIIVARKPLVGSIAENIRLWDVCPLNIGACRLVMSGGRATIDAGRWPPNVALSHSEGCVPAGRRRVKTASGYSAGFVGEVKTSAAMGAKRSTINPATVHVDPDGTEEIDAWTCAPGCMVAALDEQSGIRPSTLAGRADPLTSHANPSDNSGASSFGGGNSRIYADTGGASRCFLTLPFEPPPPFMYVGKVTTAEREFGCDGLGPQAGAGRSGGARNSGPCLKPIALTTWLAKLLLPPPRIDGAPRRICVPYCGTGSEMLGALRAGWDEIVGIERDPHFAEIARARLTRWTEVPPDFSPSEAIASARAAKQDEGQTDLFGKAGT